MNQENDGCIEQLQEMLATRDQLKRELNEKQELLDREIYQLETTEIRLRMVEEEIQGLESLTLAGVFSSITGSKIGKLDSLRAQTENLEQDYQTHSRNLEMIQQQIDTLNAQIKAMTGVEEELRALCPNAGFTQELAGEGATSQGLRAAPAEQTQQIDWLIEAGESLLTQLNGMYSLCNNLRRNKGISGRTPALLAGAMQACRSRSANAVTGQLVESVRHFYDQVEALRLNPANRAEAEVLSTLSQIARFVNAGVGVLGSQTETWAELEVLIRTLVSDLRDLRASLNLTQPT